jgi:hypothetical protein
VKPAVHTRMDVWSDDAWRLVTSERRSKVEEMRRGASPLAFLSGFVHGLLSSRQQRISTSEIDSILRRKCEYAAVKARTNFRQAKLFPFSGESVNRHPFR